MSTHSTAAQVLGNTALHNTKTTTPRKRLAITHMIAPQPLKPNTQRQRITRPARCQRGLCSNWVKLNPKKLANRQYSTGYRKASVAEQAISIRLSAGKEKTGETCFSCLAARIAMPGVAMVM
jgi:hypothetical protein